MIKSSVQALIQSDINDGQMIFQEPSAYTQKINRKPFFDPPLSLIKTDESS